MSQSEYHQLTERKTDKLLKKYEEEERDLEEQPPVPDVPSTFADPPDFLVEQYPHLYTNSSNSNNNNHHRATAGNYGHGIGMANQRNVSSGAAEGSSPVMNNGAFLEAQREAGITNIDKFLVEVYEYFYGRGLYCIFLAQLLHLVGLLWLLGLSLFVIGFVDYSVLFSTYSLEKSIGYSELSTWTQVFVGIFVAYWLWEFVRFLRTTITNVRIRSKLQLSESDLQTMEWRTVVQKLSSSGLVQLRGKKVLGPLEIASRIMRKDNYKIAMINQNVIPLSVRPFSSPVLTRPVEWALDATLFSLVFPQDANNIEGINLHLNEKEQLPHLANELRSKFKRIGWLSLILLPFTVVFLFVYSFFAYAEELRNEPGKIMTRKWSRLAYWKFREFNELPHVIDTRLAASYEPSMRYIKAFPSRFVTIVATFLSLVVGSIIAVILCISFYDDQALTKLQLFADKSPVWVLGIGGAILAALRNLIPDEKDFVDPTFAMEHVVQHTHYYPPLWHNLVHTQQVYGEFNSYFQYKLFNFGKEFMSVIYLPFFLLYYWPNNAERIISFFQNNSVKVDGVGYACKYATFVVGETNPLHADHAAKSLLNFMANHPEYQPNKNAERYLGNVKNLMSSRIGTPDMSRSQLFTSTLFEDSDPGPRPTEPISGQDSAASLGQVYRVMFRSTLSNNNKNV